MASRRKHWSRLIDESGTRVRVYERPETNSLWISYHHGAQKKRRSLKTRDRAEAERRARAVAQEIARQRLTGEVTDRLTIGELFALYDTHRLPTLSPTWATAARARIELFKRAWGEDLEVASVDQTRVDQYATLRRQGALSPFTSERSGRAPVRVRDGTLDADFRWLSSCLNWARKFKVRGRRLLRDNPLHDVQWPRKKNPLRPVASHARFERTLAAVRHVDPSGRLRCILALARYTGRRESAICSVRSSDLLLSKEPMARVLAESGMDERLADHWPYGAIRWSADNDKQGLLRVTPISREAREELDRYLAANPKLGEVPLFPAPADPSKSIDRHLAARWLLKAEKAADLPKLRGGTFHPYRRLWASERKNMPDVDVAAAGGWKDTRALKLSYQHADPVTLLRVVQARGS